MWRLCHPGGLFWLASASRLGALRTVRISYQYASLTDSDGVFRELEFASLNSEVTPYYLSKIHSAI